MKDAIISFAYGFVTYALGLGTMLALIWGGAVLVDKVPLVGTIAKVLVGIVVVLLLGIGCWDTGDKLRGRKGLDD